jgi:hypothetical protein
MSNMLKTEQIQRRDVMLGGTVPSKGVKSDAYVPLEKTFTGGA